MASGWRTGDLPSWSEELEPLDTSERPRGKGKVKRRKSIPPRRMALQRSAEGGSAYYDNLDDVDKQQKYIVDNVQRLLERVGNRGGPIQSFDDVRRNSSQIVVALFDGLFSGLGDMDIRTGIEKTKEDYVHNAKVVVDALEKQGLLNQTARHPITGTPTSRYHVTGQAIVEGDIVALRIMVDLFLEKDILVNVRWLLDYVRMDAKPILSFADVRRNASSIIVAISEEMLEIWSDSIIRKPFKKRHYIHNAQVVINTLHKELKLKTSLDHVTGEAIARGDRIAIRNLVDLFLGLTHYLEQQQGKENNGDDDVNMQDEDGRELRKPAAKRPMSAPVLGGRGIRKQERPVKSWPQPKVRANQQGQKKAQRPLGTPVPPIDEREPYREPGTSRVNVHRVNVSDEARALEMRLREMRKRLSKEVQARRRKADLLDGAVNYQSHRNHIHDNKVRKIRERRLDELLSFRRAKRATPFDQSRLNHMYKRIVAILARQQAEDDREEASRLKLMHEACEKQAKEVEECFVERVRTVQEHEKQCRSERASALRAEEIALTKLLKGVESAYRRKIEAKIDRLEQEADADMHRHTGGGHSSAPSILAATGILDLVSAPLDSGVASKFEKRLHALRARADSRQRKLRKKRSQVQLARAYGNNVGRISVPSGGAAGGLAESPKN